MEKGWREITIAGLVLEPGSSVSYKTGTWRSSRPIIDEEKCNFCLTCWVCCPDGSIMLQNERAVVEVDLDHCKGCGICAKECPQEAITIVEEGKA